MRNQLHGLMTHIARKDVNLSVTLGLLLSRSLFLVITDSLTGRSEEAVRPTAAHGNAFNSWCRSANSRFSCFTSDVGWATSTT